MKYLAYFLITLLILIIGFGIAAPLGLGWLTPSLLLLVVICMVMEYGSLDFVWFALVGGLWLEQFYGLPSGSLTGAYLIIGLFSYILFQRLFLVEATWKYYLLAVLGAEIIMLVWLWGYTALLYQIEWTTFAVSGSQIWHNSWAIIIIALIFALPVYWIITFGVRQVQWFLRRPMKLS